VVVAIERVRDLEDPRLADYVHLREPSRRMGLERRRGIFTVEGRLSVEALLSSPYPVRSILVAAEHEERMAGLLVTDAPVYSLPSDAMAQVTGVHFHRGVLAVGERRPLPSVEDLASGAARLLVLEAVNDHENVGSLFRNAAAFGVDAVLLDPATADPLYRRSVRVSLGHVLRVQWTRLAAWPDGLGELRRRGFELLALTPAAQAVPIDAVARDIAARRPKVALLVGAEGPGLSDAALVASERRVRIPIARSVDSLNVATAAAVALHRLSRFDPA
jgi:tRNA G18 (ribose-2'-O)-methylase SpoU